MTDEGRVIRVSVVLTDRGRQEAGRARVAEFLVAHALTLTGSGLATLSFVAGPDALSNAFGPSGTTNSPATRPPDAVGGGAAFTEPDITIPAELLPFVAAISVTPPAKGFGSDN